MADNYQYVKLPDGSYGKFAANANDADIRAQISKDFPAETSAAAAANPFGSSPAHAPANMPLAQMSGLDNGMALIHGVVGAAKSVPNTIAGAAKIRNAILRPIRALAGDFAPNVSQAAISSLQQTPDGNAEKVGMFGGNLAQAMLLPEAEGPLLLKAGASALGQGLLNKAQGGDFATGAASGAAGPLVGAGLKKIAPSIAEAALGVRGSDRGTAARAALHLGDGSTSVLPPGEAILQETTGVNPGTIARQGQKRVADLMQLEHNLVSNTPTTSVNLGPARATAENSYNAASLMNNDAVVKDMNELNRQLGSRPGVPLAPVVPQTTGWAGPGYRPAKLPAVERVPIPQGVPASEALALKRGVGELVGSWNPNTASDFSTGAAKQVYGALDKEIDRAVPGTAAINDRVSALLPVVGRAGSTDLNAGVVQRMISRGTAHTGALAGPLAAGAFGAAHGGVVGGLVGGLGGLVGQELLTNPTTLMTIARTADSPVTPKLAKLVALSGAKYFTPNGGDQ